MKGKDFTNICEENFLIFECNYQHQLKSGTENFLEIYIYFLNFSEFIDGFQENDLDKASNLCSIMINRIYQRQFEINQKSADDYRIKAEQDYKAVRVAYVVMRVLVKQLNTISQSQLKYISKSIQQQLELERISQEREQELRIQKLQHQYELDRISHTNRIRAVREREKEKNKRKKKKKYST